MEPGEIRAEVAALMKPLDERACLLAGHAAWFIPLQQAAHTRREDANNTASRSNAFAAFRPIARIVTRIDLASQRVIDGPTCRGRGFSREQSPPLYARP
jgi:hypothetical protein